MIFEWDENKNKINIAKHGIPFELAKEVFYDKQSIKIFSRNVESEDRYYIIGNLKNKKMLLILVVYVQRESKYRIISARIASKKEREVYYNAKEK